MINVEVIRGEEIDFYLSFIPQTLQQSYLMQANLLLYGIRYLDTACGVIVVEAQSENALIKYIYLAEDYRHRGMAGEALNELLFELYGAGYVTVSASYIPELYPDMHDRLWCMGFQIEEAESGFFSIPVDTLADKPLLKGKTNHVVALRDVSKMELNRLCNKLVETGYDLVDMPIRKEQYLADSSGVFMENGEPKGIILLEQDREKADVAKVPLLYCGASSQSAPVELVRFMAQSGLEQQQHIRTCQISALSESVKEFIRKVTGSEALKKEYATYKLSNLFQYYEMADRVMAQYVPLMAGGEER